MRPIAPQRPPIVRSEPPANPGRFIDRASWVVETAMEWRRDQNAEIPTSLLEGITRNLFTDGGDSAQAHSAADDLASALVGNASQLKVKLGNNELNFDRKGLAGLGKIDTRD